MLTLPDDLRGSFKDPFGDVYEDADALLADAGRPIVAVGDVVTYHLRQAGHVPAVALVDGRTEREAVDEAISDALADPEHRRAVENPPGAISEELLATLADAVDAPEPITIVVDGEEDLAALPAVLVTPAGGTVVYGQPGEGMVAVAVTPDAKAEMRSLLEQMTGDVEAALTTLGVDA
ncbi:GTP-dependent dephospho-CoA kinase family protein [Halobellus clavatus]|jgi:uncharacterized protein (UPF0218 family)|uniref:GTP-dependent dephospho-CoA kinase n=1 Tax=Halobellus clavatus TaxID=660517 RepID=A0A1H3DHI1_9EURY|nr:GTP-dependent dephospho-CoA kinase family protein [Halobellus clavatus]SDX65124.1 hypothetical protein SAMN04487946_101542 [Halobellus clavatus]